VLPFKTILKKLWQVLWIIGFWFFGCHGLLLNLIILTFLKLKLPLQSWLLTNMIHLFGHVGFHIDFSFHYHLLCLSCGLKPNYPKFQCEHNKARVQSIMGAMTAFGWISVNQCPTTQVQRKKERKNWSHSEWWSSPFFVNPLCSFYFQWSFPPKTSVSV
jgi:hypothetical protein